MPKNSTREFKAEAVRLVLDEQMSQAEVAKDLGVSDTSIGRWVARAPLAGVRGASAPR